MYNRYRAGQCLAAILICSLGMQVSADECGSPSPSVRGGDAYYAKLAPSRLSRGQWDRLYALVAELKAEWRGKGTIWRCGSETQRHPSQLEMEIEGALDEQLRFRKQLTDLRKGTIELQRDSLSRVDDQIEFNDQAQLAVPRLNARMLVFHAKFKIRARDGNIINRELVRSLHLQGDALIYEEREYTQGLLSWQGRWTLKRII